MARSKVTVSGGVSPADSLDPVALEAAGEPKTSRTSSPPPRRWLLFVITPLMGSLFAFGSVAVATKGIAAWKSARHVQAVVSTPILVRPPRRTFEDAEAMLPRKVDAAQLRELQVATAPKRAAKARTPEDDEVAAAAAILAKAKGERSLD